MKKDQVNILDQRAHLSPDTVPETKSAHDLFNVTHEQNIPRVLWQKNALSSKVLNRFCSSASTTFFYAGSKPLFLRLKSRHAVTRFSCAATTDPCEESRTSSTS